jgi:hypothetical protein
VAWRWAPEDVWETRLRGRAAEEKEKKNEKKKKKSWPQVLVKMYGN